MRAVGEVVRWVAVLGALALSTSCQGDSDAGGPSEPPSLAGATDASPTRSSWRSSYDDEQLAAYDEALARWSDYERRSEPIWAAGRSTPEAERLFQEFFPSPGWVGVAKDLRTYEQAGVELHGVPSVFWSEAVSVSADARSVRVRQCIDYGTTTTFQHGEETERIASRLGPVLREISLERPRGYDWLVYDLDLTPGPDEEDESCDPEA